VLAYLDALADLHVSYWDRPDALEAGGLSE
jgi:hypothetical protein